MPLGSECEAKIAAYSAANGNCPPVSRQVRAPLLPEPSERVSGREGSGDIRIRSLRLRDNASDRTPASYGRQGGPDRSESTRETISSPFNEPEHKHCCQEKNGGPDRKMDRQKQEKEDQAGIKDHETGFSHGVAPMDLSFEAVAVFEFLFTHRVATELSVA